MPQEPAVLFKKRSTGKRRLGTFRPSCPCLFETAVRSSHGRPKPPSCDDPRPDLGQFEMNSEQDERRFAEEEIRDVKKRAAEKPNLAITASWVLAGILVAVVILSSI